jgi:thioredoxin-dependent peroxiredoxin
MSTITLLTSLVLAATPKQGDVAPDFTANDTDGKSIQLSKLVEKGTVIVAFFPKAFTGG